MAGRRPAHLSGDRAADRGPHPRQDRRRLGLPQWRSKLAAYVGLAPVTRQSGTSLAGESGSRRGNRRLKNAMFLAVFASLRDPASKAFYDRKRAEGKRHNAAVICPAAAATSPWPCSAPASPTGPPATHPAWPTPPDPRNLQAGLNKEHGDIPRMDHAQGACPAAGAVHARSQRPGCMAAQ
jgi:hypothetical protein